MAHVNLQQLAIDQEQDRDCRSDQGDTSLSMMKVDFPGLRNKLWCDSSLQRLRVYILKNWSKQVFRVTHSLAHPSGKATLTMVFRNCVWKDTKKEIKNWVRECAICATNKVSQHTKPPSTQSWSPAHSCQHGRPTSSNPGFSAYLDRY